MFSQIGDFFVPRSTHESLQLFINAALRIPQIHRDLEIDAHDFIKVHHFLGSKSQNPHSLQ
jgi:hypothetical protein